MNGYTYLLDTVAVVYLIQSFLFKFTIMRNSFYCYIVCITVVGDDCGMSFVHECEIFLGYSYP